MSDPVRWSASALPDQQQQQQQQRQRQPRQQEPHSRYNSEPSPSQSASAPAPASASAAASSPATGNTKPHSSFSPRPPSPVRQNQNQNHSHQQQQHHEHYPPLRPLQPQPLVPASSPGGSIPPPPLQPYLPHPLAHPYPRPPFMFPYPPSHPPPSNAVPNQDDRYDSKRMRISRACDGCRRKKVRCDTEGRGAPCKNCQASNMECTFNDSAKKRGPPKGYIEVLENRLKRMERILGNLAETGGGSGSAESSREASAEEDGDGVPSRDRSSSSVADAVAGTAAAATTTVITAGASPQEPLSARPPPPPQQQPSPTTPQQSPASTSATPSRPDNRPKSNKCVFSDTGQWHPTHAKRKIEDALTPALTSDTATRYIGDMSPLPFLAQKINFEDDRVSSHIGFKVRKFGQTLMLYRDEGHNGDNPASIQLLQSLNMLKPGESINTLNDWIYRVAGVDKVTSDRLMKVYFAYIHPGLPLVNKQVFLKQYRRQGGDYPSAPLLNAIYGAAVRYLEICNKFGDQVIPEVTKEDWSIGWSEQLFENLLKYVKARYSPCVSTIQALVIGQFHRASYDEKMASSWLLTSAATRMAQDLGLHRSSEGWDLPDDEKETRRRVWWTVYIMDRWSAAGFGRPQTIFDEDCDESYPSDSASWEEVMDEPVGYSPSEDDDDPRFPSLDRSMAQKVKGEKIPLYQPFFQLVRLSEILGRILQGLYTPKAKRHSAEHGSDAIVRYLNEALSEWRNALPPSLQLSTTNVRRLDGRGQTPLLSMSGLIYLAYCTLLILLHRPFIVNESGKSTSQQSTSLMICVNAATRCIDIAEKMHYRDFLLTSWNFAIFPMFTAALIHMYNTGSQDPMAADMARDNLDRVMILMRTLSKLSPGAERLMELLEQLESKSFLGVGNGEEGGDASPEDICRRRNSQATAARKRKQSDREPQQPSQPSQKQKQRQHQQQHHTVSPLQQQQQQSQARDARRESIESAESNYRSGIMSPRVSDVGRGSARSSPALENASSIPPPPQTPHLPPDQESGGSTPSSVLNGDWINGLFGDASDSLPQQQQQQPPMQPLQHRQQEAPLQPPPQQQQQQPQQQSPPFMVPTTADIHATWRTLMMDGMASNLNRFQGMGPPPPPTMAPVGGNMTAPLQSADSFLLGIPDFGGFGFSQQQQQQHPMFRQAMANMFEQAGHFRNRPDNPFWSIPSSMELDDWSAYLLPQQQQQQPQQPQSQTDTDASSAPQPQAPSNYGTTNNSWM